MKEVRIIQVSPQHTGSTLLVNLIHGFLSPMEPVHWKTEDLIDDYLITKTHNTDIENFEKKYPNYKLYFIMSERNDKKIQEIINFKYREKKNVLIINYNEMLETRDNTLDKIIINIFKKFLKFLPKEIIPNKKKNLIKMDMKDRINKMNKICKEIEDKPFDYCDEFTHIHGGHRNRDKIC